jgi:hypothetical protein
MIFQSLSILKDTAYVALEEILFENPHNPVETRITAALYVQFFPAKPLRPNGP